MTGDDKCPRCGARLAEASLKGRCPQCLARYSFLELEPDPVDPGRSAGTEETILLSPDNDLEAGRTGMMIGRYKLLEQIGEGGFGVVYMAEQVEPVQRKVALKIIKAGMDSRAVVARFEAERQAAALMDHPNIARVLDGGVTQAGRPYFVMELVRGIPITEFCDRARLGTTERLHLFIRVCKAVQHAHQKGIIHRDLKPSNILVTMRDGEPVPKIIDFGVAKALGQRLTDKTLFTGFMHMIGTPAYMSPEQAELSGVDVDTRSDIYSLGVLLYELLTGVTPFDPETLRKAGLDDVRRMIRETEPVKPSTRVQTLGQKLGEIALHRQVAPPKLMHTLRGDLDWIVMQCLDKDRRRRYETANGLAMDVQRHLNCEPVVARPPSRLYEFQKTVRRHRVGFIMTVSVMAALLVGLAVATLALVREREARERAVAAEQSAKEEVLRSAQVAQFMKDMLGGVGPSVALGRDTELLREILDQTAERVGNELTNQPEVELELRNAISDAYWEIGQHALAEANYRQTVELTGSLYGDEHPALADAQHRLAECLRRMGQNAEAEELELKALAIYRGAYGEEHPAVAAVLNNLIHVYESLGRPDEAVTAGRRALAMNEELLGEGHPSVGVSLSRLGSVLAHKGELEEAEGLLRRAVALQKTLRASQSEDRDPMELPWALYRLAEVLQLDDRLPEAEGVSREASAEGRKVLGAAHPDLATFSGQLVDTLHGQGKLESAAELLREDIAWMSQQPGTDPARLTDLRIEQATMRVEMGDSQAIEELHSLLDQRLRNGAATDLYPWRYVVLGRTMQQQEKAAEAQGCYEIALRLYSRQTLEGTDDGLLSPLEWALRHRRDWPALEELFSKCLSERRAFLLKQDPWSVGEDAGVAFLLYGLAKVTEAQVRPESAANYRQDAFRILSAGNATNACTFKLAVLVREEGDLDLALRLARQSLRVRERGRSEWVLHPVRLSATLLEDLGEAREAKAVLRHGVDLYEEYQEEGLYHASVALGNFVWALLERGMIAEAESIAERELDGSNAKIMNALAWFYATSPDPTLRNGEKAVRIAEKSVAETSRNDANILDTLAAAYAEVGDFPNAISVQKEAIALLAGEEKRKSGEFLERLNLYESGQPYHEEAEVHDTASSD